MYSRQAVTYDREKYFTLAQKLEKNSSRGGKSARWHNWCYHVAVFAAFGVFFIGVRIVVILFGLEKLS